MREHTPGPWGLQAGRCITTQDGDFTISKCNNWDPSKVCELDANARLIAAAPELLSVLTGVTRALDRMVYKYDRDSIESEWIGNANEVIRNATGKDLP